MRSARMLGGWVVGLVLAVVGAAAPAARGRQDDNEETPMARTRSENSWIFIGCVG
mgnify:CR=1 FL=1